MNHLTPAQIRAVRAAVARVWPHLTGSQYEIELSWVLQDVVISSKGAIHWRAFELGRLFFAALAEAQNWRCCYCGVPTTDEGMRCATLEHVRPLGNGGADHPDNMVMACYWCNVRRPAY